MTLGGEPTPVVEGEVPCGGDPEGGGAGADLSAANLFAVLWEAARGHPRHRRRGHAPAPRGAARGCRAGRSWPRSPSRGRASTTATRVPSAWKDPAPDPPQALRELARELWTLLVDLTGSVVVNRLAQIPELRDRGIVPQREEQP